MNRRRFLVFGLSPLPQDTDSPCLGPGRRAWQLVKPLLLAGHDIRLITCRPGRAVTTAAAPTEVDAGLGNRCLRIETNQARFEDPVWGAAQVKDFAPDAIIGATIYPSAVACRIAGELPVWGDAFGHAMAEAQTKAALEHSDYPLDVFWEYERTVVDRADRISTVSQRQAWAVIGELGVRGRLTGRNAGYRFTDVIPCGFDPAAPLARALGPYQPERDGEFHLLWSGGFNTWTDVDTLFRGIELAMNDAPTLRFIATGGAIAGHDEQTYGRFQALVEQSPHRDRYRLAGWVEPHERDTLLARAQLAINIDRPSWEAELGSRNRIVDWLANGLPFLTTPLCELAAETVRRGFAFAFPPGDPEALAGCLRAAIAQPLRLDQMSAAASAAADDWGFIRTTAPLLEWCAAPARAPDGANRAVLDLPSARSGLPLRRIAIALRRHLRNDGVRGTLRWTLAKIRQRLPRR